MKKTDVNYARDIIKSISVALDRLELGSESEEAYLDEKLSRLYSLQFSESRRSLKTSDYLAIGDLLRRFKVDNGLLIAITNFFREDYRNFDTDKFNAYVLSKDNSNITNFDKEVIDVLR